ncbi:cbb3-type cytochrome oxidase assembly protein CcoS [Glaciecola siphonariae]|uniref:Cbb3-type cytochrome oxidase assembly protein CcoS n=1 Tax=Glaciecola siphonariae TaxID=521012 RepID=A0ABV9LT99_9ALTE
MSIIFVLIPLAIIIVSIAVGVFFWAVKSNQFDDLERQGYSILFDDDIKKPNEKEKLNTSTQLIEGGANRPISADTLEDKAISDSPDAHGVTKASSAKHD